MAAVVVAHISVQAVATRVAFSGQHHKYDALGRIVLMNFLEFFVNLTVYLIIRDHSSFRNGVVCEVNSTN